MGGGAGRDVYDDETLAESIALRKSGVSGLEHCHMDLGFQGGKGFECD